VSGNSAARWARASVDGAVDAGGGSTSATLLRHGLSPLDAGASAS
jgi:hypothetical protein